MGQYVPADSSDPEAARIAQAFSSPNDWAQLNELDALPKKYGDGMVIFISAALAVTLGLAGRGFYGRYGGAWNRLG